MEIKASETTAENLFREYYGTKAFIEKSAIPKECGFMSKNETQHQGYPDFYKDCGLYSIIVEAKPTDNKAAQDDVCFYMLNNKLRNKKDLIGIAVSGQNENEYCATYFCLFKNSEQIVSLKINGLVPLKEIKTAYLKIKCGDFVSDTELTTILTGLNKNFHDNNVRDSDRSLFFSFHLKASWCAF